MIHAPINTGDGWRCNRCGVNWDQGEPEPPDCLPSSAGRGTQPLGPPDDSRALRRYSDHRIAEGLRVSKAAVETEFISGTDPFDPLVRTLQTMNVTDPMKRQVAGVHYQKFPLQPTEFCMRNGLDPCVHGIIKYIARWRDKGGVTDLEKAIHYVEIRAKFLYDAAWPPITPIPMLDFVTMNSIPTLEAEALYRLEAWYRMASWNAVAGTTEHTRAIVRVVDAIQAIIDEAKKDA